MTTTTDKTDAQGTGRGRRILQRTAAAGFAFFLLKGLAWLLVPAIIWAVRG